jgi:putative hydrolases of HD superfamily
MDRLQQQLSFILEIDKLKSILRQTILIDRSRRENTAEHSWHLAIMANLLAEYATSPIDVARVTRMVLAHDIVEIDAGDTFAYDTAGIVTKKEREHQAAHRVFGLLPPEQGRELRELWEEFEAEETVDSQFANAIDRLEPCLLNANTEGGTWKEHTPSLDKVMERMKPVKLYMPQVWPVVQKIIDEAVANGWVKA